MQVTRLPRLFIHVGLPKTGTTYLQNSFEWFEKQNRFESVGYPLLAEHDSFLEIHSGNAVSIGHYLSQRLTPKFEEPVLQHRLEDLLAKVKDPGRDVLISSEFFSTPPPDRVDTLVRCIDRLGYQPQILVVVRPLADMLFSAYSQCVKRDAVGKTFEAWVARAGSRLPGAYITKVVSYGLPVQVIPYHRQELLGSILSAIGEDPELAAKVPKARVNRSLSRAELDLLVTINRIFHDPQLSTNISDRLIREYPDRRPAKPKTSELDSAQRAIQSAEPPLNSYSDAVAREMVRLFLAETARLNGPPEEGSKPSQVDIASLNIGLSELSDYLGKDHQTLLEKNEAVRSQAAGQASLPVQVFQVAAVRIRDLALALEPYSLKAALDFMRLAQLGRPNGELIIRKIRQYEDQLASSEEDEGLNAEGLAVIRDHADALRELVSQLGPNHREQSEMISQYIALCQPGTLH